MQLQSECLEALAGLFQVCQKTARDYERDCPGAKEVGYWNHLDKADYEKARALLKSAYTQQGVALPAWLLED